MGYDLFTMQNIIFLIAAGTCLLTFVLGATASGLTAMDMSPFAVTLYAALVNVIGLSLFIFSAAPASGGHLNPSIVRVVHIIA